ncbi:hypothetical protein Vadar_001966 [Vaccinium darrowii]|nr:hypothetical protein Vadar_001966 [Vaccinium darrowii]
MLHLSHSPTTATLSGHHFDCAFGLALSTHRRSAFGFPMVNNFPTALSSSSTLLKPHITCGASHESSNTSHRKNDLPVHGVSETVVGVLGGGQLSQMLCQATSPLAIKVIFLDPMENCPAGALSYCHVLGSYDDSVTVEEFAKRCSVLTIEIEHVNVVTLEKHEQQGLDVQPKASTIRIIQIDDPESAKKAGDLFGYPLMIKSRRLAYDGRGNVVAKREEEISSAVQSKIFAFVNYVKLPHNTSLLSSIRANDLDLVSPFESIKLLVDS